MIEVVKPRKNVSKVVKNNLVTIISKKGGVGKSLSASNLAYYNSVYLRKKNVYFDANYENADGLRRMRNDVVSIRFYPLEYNDDESKDIKRFLTQSRTSKDLLYALPQIEIPHHRERNPLKQERMKSKIFKQIPSFIDQLEDYTVFLDLNHASHSGYRSLWELGAVRFVVTDMGDDACLEDTISLLKLLENERRVDNLRDNLLSLSKAYYFIHEKDYNFTEEQKDLLLKYLEPFKSEKGKSIRKSPLFDFSSHEDFKERYLAYLNEEDKGSSHYEKFRLAKSLVRHEKGLSDLITDPLNETASNLNNSEHPKTAIIMNMVDREENYVKELFERINSHSEFNVDNTELKIPYLQSFHENANIGVPVFYTGIKFWIPILDFIRLGFKSRDKDFLNVCNYINESLGEMKNV